MKLFKYPVRCLVAVAGIASIGIASPNVVHAATPVVETDHGAFVRIVGNPSDGTIKFQYGWGRDTPASDAAGYWIGVYDITHSHYMWSSDTGPTELPDQLWRNARPTAELPNADYKVVFFVRDAYGDPTTNISEIELPFTVNYASA